MPFQANDGTWWSDDRRYYLSGNQWLLYSGTTQQIQASTQQSSAQRPPAQQPSPAAQPLGTTTPSTLAAALNAFPQNSAAPYQQQGQLVFGRNRQTPGTAAVPAITLDPNLRAAASRNMMIWGFVKSMDDMARGRSS